MQRNKSPHYCDTASLGVQRHAALSTFILESVQDLNLLTQQVGSLYCFRITVAVCLMTENVLKINDKGFHLNEEKLESI